MLKRLRFQGCLWELLKLRAAGCGDERPRLSQRTNQIMSVLNAKYMLLRLGIIGKEVVFDRIEIILEPFYVA